MTCAKTGFVTVQDARTVHNFKTQWSGDWTWLRLIAPNLGTQCLKVTTMHFFKKGKFMNHYHSHIMPHIIPLTKITTVYLTSTTKYFIHYGIIFNTFASISNYQNCWVYVFFSNAKFSACKAYQQRKSFRGVKDFIADSNETSKCQHNNLKSYRYMLMCRKLK